MAGGEMPTRSYSQQALKVLLYVCEKIILWFKITTFSLVNHGTQVKSQSKQITSPLYDPSNQSKYTQFKLLSWFAREGIRSVAPRTRLLYLTSSMWERTTYSCIIKSVDWLWSIAHTSCAWMVHNVIQLKCTFLLVSISWTYHHCSMSL